MTFIPENNRHYIAMVKPVYETLEVPDLFRAKLGRIYETPDEQDTEAPAQERRPSQPVWRSLKRYRSGSSRTVSCSGYPCCPWPRSGRAKHYTNSWPKPGTWSRAASGC